MPEDDKVKQVIVMRKDLKMRRGKEIAQGSHASMMFMTDAINYVLMDNSCGDDDCCGQPTTIDTYFDENEIEWMQGKFTKVTLQVNSESELDEIFESANNAGLEVYMVEDEGITEFNGVKTKTCLAIGPDKSSKIDPITSHLKLY